MCDPSLNINCKHFLKHNHLNILEFGALHAQLLLKLLFVTLSVNIFSSYIKKIQNFAHSININEFPKDGYGSIVGASLDIKLDIVHRPLRSLHLHKYII